VENVFQCYVPPVSKAARVTIVDVAREAGVRPSTVSKALNGGRGSAEVRRRVEEAAARLGYRPSQRAQALRTSQSRSIGLLVPDLVNPAYLSLLRGVENVAHERGYVVLVADGQRSAAAQTAALERFFEHGVDGLVLGGPVPAEGLRLHLHHGVPISPPVSDYERRLAHHWEQGEATATREMGRRLLDLGHRRFGFVSTPPLPGSGRFRRGRLAALSKLVGEAGAELVVSLVDPDRDPDGCRARLGALVAGDRAPTALVCANQLVAPWLLMAVRDAGRRLPDDVSLVVYGDSDWARAHPPPLSVVARDTFAEGQSLAASLLDAVAGIDAPRRPAADARYVERGSCARPPA
jgi:LacI family transcriptional regulator